MIEPLEDFAFKCEACTLFFVWINDLFEGIQIAFNTPIPYKIDSTKAALAKQVLYNVALLYNAPYWESRLHTLHSCPSHQIGYFFMITSGNNR
jgi:hypothetical protein